MAKKLKKKIEEVCGLANLEIEAKQARAKQILANTEWKQQLCNELVGLSFRELERTLNGIIAGRQIKDDEETYKNEKLATYRNPKSRDDSGRKSQRTLSEILAQVYKPRVETSHSPKRNDILKGISGTYSANDEEILSDFIDVHREPGE